MVIENIKKISKRGDNKIVGKKCNAITSPQKKVGNHRQVECRRNVKN
jgi:hypothetical protein